MRVIKGAPWVVSVTFTNVKIKFKKKIKFT